MEVLTSILNFFDTVLWSSPLIYISIFVGLLYTVGLKGFQIRYLKQMVNSVLKRVQIVNPPHHLKHLL